MCAWFISKLLHSSGTYIEKISILSLSSAGCLLYLSRAAVYEEAIVSSLAFGLAAMFFWLRSIGNPSWSLSILILVLLTCGANSRPTVFGLGIGLGIGTFFLLQDLKFRLVGCFYVLVPIVTVFGVNYLKFRMVIPDLSLNEQVPEAAHWATIYAANGSRDMSPTFILTTSFNYLRIDALSFSRDFPFIDFGISGTNHFRSILLNRGALYVERMTSVPIAYLGSVVIIGFNASQAVRKRWGLTISGSYNTAVFWLTAGSLLSVIPTLTNVAMTNRYILDFLPLMVVAVLMSLTVPKKEQKQLSFIGRFSLGSIVLMGFLINLILLYRWSWS